MAYYCGTAAKAALPDTSIPWVSTGVSATLLERVYRRETKIFYSLFHHLNGPNGQSQADPTQSQDPGASSGSPTWVKDPKHLGYILCCFPMPQQSLIKNGAATTRTSAQMGCQSLKMYINLFSHGASPSCPLIQVPANNLRKQRQTAQALASHAPVWETEKPPAWSWTSSSHSGHLGTQSEGGSFTSITLSHNWINL